MLIDHIITVHLTLMGIFRNRKYENYEKYLFTLLITLDVIIFVSYIIVFPQAQLFVHQCSLITTSLGAFVFCLHRIIVNTRRVQVLRIIGTLKNGNPYFCEARVKINENIDLWENFYPIVTRVIFLAVIVTAMPYIYVLSNEDFNYNDPDIYVLTYLYHFRDVHTFWGFLMLQIVQAATCSYSASTYFSFIGFVSCVLSNITAHITEINLQLNDLISDFSMLRNLHPKDDESLNLLTDQFISLIKYQLYLQKYIKDFADFLSPIFSYYVLQFVFLAFGFAVLGTELLKSNVATLLQTISLLTIFLYGFYTWCNVCENISHTNEAILASFYQTKWYKLPLNVRKLMIMTMQHTQRPTKIRAFGIFTINFELGIQILKIIYSMVNFLQFK